MTAVKNHPLTPVSAVLTGDIVNSTTLPAKKSIALIHSLEESFAAHSFEFYRGDAFQLFVPDAAEALRIALRSRSIAIAAGEENGTPADVRIGIGIGKVELPVEKLGTARGEAFLLSGRSFDGLSGSGERLILAAGGEWASLSLAILGNEINGIFETLTARQAEVLAEMLAGSTQREAALKLQRSQSTIHQHLVAGHWAQIEKCLRHYQEIIALLNRQLNEYDGNDLAS